jgi:hypothetical protein
MRFVWIVQAIPPPCSAAAFSRFHGTRKLTRQATAVSPTVIARVTLMPAMYDMMMDGISSLENTRRICVAPVPMTTAGLMLGAVSASLTIIRLTKPDCAAAVENAPPMV